MEILWQNGPMLVKDIQKLYEDPKPHINTVSTIVRILEDKGFVGHESMGKTYKYHALMSKEGFRKKTLKNVMSKYFNNSYRELVSSLIVKENLSVEEFKSLIELIEKAHKK